MARLLSVRGWWSLSEQVHNNTVLWAGVASKVPLPGRPPGVHALFSKPPV